MLRIGSVDVTLLALFSYENTLHYPYLYQREG